MTSRVRYALWAAVLLLVELPARPCGPFFTEAFFVRVNGPDDVARFAAGRLGVVQPTYFTRHLAVAYRWMTARPLSAAEQKETVAVNDFYAHPLSSDPSDQTKEVGWTKWDAARKGVGPIDGGPADPAGTMYIKSNDYTYTLNCMDDAFATAANTLAARAAAHGGPHAPEVMEWTRGQDAVFSNCGGSGSQPRELPAAASLWLRQDRAYQRAAADFYAQRYDDALAGFRALAADTASPWSMTARYVEARVLIRKATMATDPISPTPQQLAARSQSLQAARAELLAMRTEPRMQPMRNAVDDLLSFVQVRLDPGAEAQADTERLRSGQDRRFGQDLIDLTWLHTAVSPDEKPGSYNRTPPPVHGAAGTGDDMLAWINAMELNDGKTIERRWQETHAPVWLVAKLARAQPGDADAAELAAAAGSVAASAPAYLAVTYYRLRLTAGAPGTHAEVLRVLGTLKDEGASTTNLFGALAAASAPSLDQWLQHAAQIPAAEGIDSEDDGGTGDVQAPLCSADGKTPDRWLFPPEAAAVLNTQMPLTLLAQAAESNVLPENLRFQVAQAAWTRAVLLDRPEIARRLSPVLIGCRAAWKEVLPAYDNARTAEERKLAGLLALMRFASTEPNARAGEERPEGFATYSEFRDNWWCEAVPRRGPHGEPQPHPQDFAIGGGFETPPVNAPAPAFLSAADQRAAAEEQQQLAALPVASTYFVQQALAWQKAHPHDVHAAELLGEALRVYRNGCVEKAAIPLAHQAFDTLHAVYPQSVWAQRTKTFDDHSPE